MINDATNKTVDVGDCFLHHILGYDTRGRFVAGASSDGTTWGPNLPDGFLLELGAGERIAASMHLLNLKSETMTFKLRYTIKYYLRDQIPAGTQFATSRVYASNFNVPVNPTGMHLQTTRFSIAGGMIVSAVGHVHQGGKNITVTQASTGKILCKSVAKYSNTDKCYFEEWCAKCGEGQKPMTELLYNDITPCDILHPLANGNQDVIIQAYYDASCSYNNVMGWVFFYATDK